MGQVTEQQLTQQANTAATHRTCSARQKATATRQILSAGAQASVMLACAGLQHWECNKATTICIAADS
jgi:hypothetical protein